MPHTSTSTAGASGLRYTLVDTILRKNGHAERFEGDKWTALDTSKPVNGGATRDRTADLLHAMQALSQLSYSPTTEAQNTVIGYVCQASANKKKT